ncbi:hypothetical protein CBOM_03037 [Ceraceosorus bombacis]|uniref:Uncharacterized protein n=1 Tax=Ceraceosorus bombacis TaxID=401625 RepID=A0A0P1BM24_9BASI|nr:hypothetical protein CBOM_03037 [Ceraceosorus bombacis]
MSTLGIDHSPEETLSDDEWATSFRVGVLSDSESQTSVSERNDLSVSSAARHHTPTHDQGRQCARTAYIPDEDESDVVFRDTPFTIAARNAASRNTHISAHKDGSKSDNSSMVGEASNRVCVPNSNPDTPFKMPDDADSSSSQNGPKAAGSPAPLQVQRPQESAHTSGSAVREPTIPAKRRTLGIRPMVMPINHFKPPQTTFAFTRPSLRPPPIRQEPPEHASDDACTSPDPSSPNTVEPSRGPPKLGAGLQRARVGLAKGNISKGQATQAKLCFIPPHDKHQMVQDESSVDPKVTAVPFDDYSESIQSDEEWLETMQDVEDVLSSSRSPPVCSEPRATSASAISTSSLHELGSTGNRRFPAAGVKRSAVGTPKQHFGSMLPFGTPHLPADHEARGDAAQYRAAVVEVREPSNPRYTAEERARHGFELAAASGFKVYEDPVRYPPAPWSSVEPSPRQDDILYTSAGQLHPSMARSFPLPNSTTSQHGWSPAHDLSSQGAPLPTLLAHQETVPHSLFHDHLTHGEPNSSSYSTQDADIVGHLPNYDATEDDGLSDTHPGQDAVQAGRVSRLTIEAGTGWNQASRASCLQPRTHTTKSYNSPADSALALLSSPNHRRGRRTLPMHRDRASPELSGASTTRSKHRLRDFRYRAAAHDEQLANEAWSGTLWANKLGRSLQLRQREQSSQRLLPSVAQRKGSGNGVPRMTPQGRANASKRLRLPLFSNQANALQGPARRQSEATGAHQRYDTDEDPSREDIAIFDSYTDRHASIGDGDEQQRLTLFEPSPPAKRSRAS